MVLGGGELHRETVAMFDEPDDLQNLIKQIDKSTKKKLDALERQDRRAYEVNPGQFMGIEHYTDNEVSKQRGILNLDIGKVSQKIDYVSRTRIRGNNATQKVNKK